MVQLSLVGPPGEPGAMDSRYRLRRKIHTALAASLAAHGLDPEVLHDVADAVVEELTRGPQSLDHRTIVLRLCGHRPTCWICGFAIALTEPERSHGSFTIDHVVPRSAGGGRLGVANLKPAHRLCNILRGAKELRRSTQARYAAFLQELERREALEERADRASGIA